MNGNLQPLSKVNFYREINANCSIKDIIPGKKQINIIFIVLEKKRAFKLKNEQFIHPFLVADSSGSIFCNFYDEVGMRITEGDIIYVQSAYGTLFKSNLVLYTPKLDHGAIIKIDEFYYPFKEFPNYSEVIYKKVGENFEIDNDAQQPN